MQSLLGRLYDVEVKYDVHDFLVTDRRALSGIAVENDTRALDEALFVAETTDGAGLSLYLDPRPAAAARKGGPSRRLTEGNIADYCTALEGVSHFVYTAWRLDRDAPVSLLELETQAEVDKYAATVFLVGRQQGGRLSHRGACTAVRSCQLRLASEAGTVRTATAPPIVVRLSTAGAWSVVSCGEARRGSRPWCANCEGSTGLGSHREAAARACLSGEAGLAASNYSALRLAPYGVAGEDPPFNAAEWPR